MTPKKLKERRERILKLDRALKKLFPHATTELKFKTPWQFMVAVQLSAQCTDKQVNKITTNLFKKYKKLEDYLNTNPTEFEKHVHSCTYSFQKTRNILAAAKMLKKEFNGRLPKTLAELVRLPGVGRKTANVVLGEIYGISEGITVDTHVIRFVERFNLSDHKDPKKIEQDLMLLVPKKEWPHLTHRIIFYGRYVAPARVYDTTKDPLIKIYPKAGTRFRAS
ncbi:endonuclease III [Acetobacteraceae bacterium]|nr:endonuclease III [Candidatus Parcubacteria bacterium]